MANDSTRTLVDSNVLLDIAAVAGYRLLTRDAKRYRTYFPTVIIESPDAMGSR